MANVSKLRLNGISYDIKDNDAREQLALIQNQFNQLIAPSGEAPNPAQIQNARIGVDGVVYNTLGNAIRTQINNLNNIIINNGGGLSTDAKMALLTCFQKVAWIDDQGQIYYNALYNSLFPTAISISVIFNSASHVFYDTDTLNDLRPYLTVRATLPDNTTEIITNYSLRGSMTVGTNIITVQYQELTDTFSVTVAANPSYITAVFTQPQATIYTDDDIDILKSNLVVTFFREPGETGTVLASSAYALTGTLTEGTSVITAEYQGLTDTFNVANVVDYYEQSEWSTQNLLQTAAVVPGLYNDTCGYEVSQANLQVRRSLWAYRGLMGAYNSTSGSIDSTKYPIPVPSDASAVSVACSNISDMYYGLQVWTYDESTGKYTRTQNFGWTSMDATPTKQLPNGTQFITANFKIGTASKVFTTEPDVTITYS